MSEFAEAGPRRRARPGGYCGPLPTNEPLLIPARILAGDFGGWLRDAMAERGMSYRMLAVQAGVDHSTIQRLAMGGRLPSLATAVAIIRVFERRRITPSNAAEVRLLGDSSPSTPQGGAS